MDNQNSLIVIKDLLQVVWEIAQQTVGDDEKLDQISQGLTTIQDELQELASSLANVTEERDQYKEQGHRAAQALLKQRDAMKDWKNTSDPRVEALVEQVGEHIFENMGPEMRLSALMQLQESLQATIYEALDIDEFGVRHNLSLDLSYWIVGLEADEMTDAQKDALKSLAEAVGGVWLGDVEE